MKFKILEKDVWKIVALVDDAGVCPLEDQLVEFRAQKKYRAAVIGFSALFEQSIGRFGPRNLPKQLYHYVDQDEGIYEFIKGSLRLICFEVDGAIVICSHIMVKKSNKTKKADKLAAIKLKHDYLKALAEQDIEFECMEEKDD